jgi:hypothetical protein
MEITMDDSRLINVTQLAEFLKGSQGVNLSLRNAAIDKKYDFINKITKQFNYRKLSKKEKRIVYVYLRKITGYKKAQLYRLLEKASIGQLKKDEYKRVNPHKIYTAYDIKLLEKTDELHLRLSEKATLAVLKREAGIFGHRKYQTLSHVSHAHITNLRHSPIYKSSWINHTKARQTQIGLTQKPENYGKPGSIRVDSVSQKDVYYINTVDEITQWEIVFCVPQISESCVLPALEDILSQYPFIIFNFHSDRGGENINYQVADLLQRLLIKQTKSRSYHSNDNALVETKNGSIIRKNMGWEHIDQKLCDKINIYLIEYFNPYLNFHRPCGYPTITTDDKGKKKKVYSLYQTPYEALKQTTMAINFLKPGQSIEKLDIIAYSHSDNDWAEIMREKERILFEEVRKYNKNGGSFT